MMTTTKPPVEQTVMTVLGNLSEAAAAEIATTAGLGHSTVSKTLVKLEGAGFLTLQRQAEPPRNWPMMTVTSSAIVS